MFSIFDEHVKLIRVNVRQRDSAAKLSLLSWRREVFPTFFTRYHTQSRYIEQWTARSMRARAIFLESIATSKKPQISHCFNLYLPFGTFIVNGLFYRPEKQV
jgi:hypothetical protein